MSAVDEYLIKSCEQWRKRLKKAVQTDSWGQVIEAVEEYERLALSISEVMEDSNGLSTKQKKGLQNIAKALQLRAKCLSSIDGDRNFPSKEDMEEVLEFLKSVFAEITPVFPLDMSSSTSVKSTEVQVVEDRDEDLEDISSHLDKEKIEVPPRIAGQTYLNICIEKIGLKDSTRYINPTIAVYVYDKSGRIVEERKEIPVGNCVAIPYITFKSSVQLTTSLSDMKERDYAIFFEFVHYKPQKRKKSCRCWTLVEMDEVKNDGPLALELYQKPMDPKRKRINLFTEKELYFHIRLQHETI